MLKSGCLKLIGASDEREAIDLGKQTFWIRLISTYEALLCDTYARKLLEKLVSEGADENLASCVAENACLAAMCLVDEGGRQVFNDGFSALSSLTPEELLNVTRRYTKLNNQFLRLTDLDNEKVEKVKKN